MQAQTANFSNSASMQTYRRSRVVLVALLILCGYFVYGYTTRLAAKAEIVRANEALRAKIVQAQQTGRRLEMELKYVTSPDYIDRVAREEFDLAKPGDRVIVMVDPVTGAPAVTNILGLPAGMAAGRRTTTPEVVPVWQQWLDFLAEAAVAP
jgi:cell division protein FtsB